MQWERLTAKELAIAIRKTGVCVFPMGVLEKHSEHLPVGTDMIVAHKVACLAAEKEPAVVFPPWFFGQIYEARCFPGAITIRPTLLLELLEAMFDEIGRNGFRKIIIFSGHGGNRFLVPFIAQCSLWEEKAYSLYVPQDRLTPERQKKWNAILKTSEHGHACECETSVSLALHPELVKMSALPAKPAKALGRLKKLPGMFAGVSWYADYPDHYAGDARTASARKGRELIRLRVETFAEYIAAVKADKVVSMLEKEFFRGSRNPVGK